MPAIAAFRMSNACADHGECIADLVVTTAQYETWMAPRPKPSSAAYASADTQKFRA